MDTAAQLTGALLPLARQWRRVIDAALEPFGLSEAIAGPLIYLGRSGGGITQGELAALSGVGEPALVRVVGLLVADGLVARRGDPDDRRLKRLDLTPAGRQLATEIEAAIGRSRDHVLQGIPQEAIETSLNVLDRMRAALALSEVTHVREGKAVGRRDA